MSDPTPPFTRVCRVWDPYIHREVKQCLQKTHREFGQPNQGRWYFRIDVDGHRCTVDFYFADPHDAMIFALKYLS